MAGRTVCWWNNKWSVRGKIEYRTELPNDGGNEGCGPWPWMTSLDKWRMYGVWVSTEFEKMMVVPDGSQNGLFTNMVTVGKMEGERYWTEEKKSQQMGQKAVATTYMKQKERFQSDESKELNKTRMGAERLSSVGWGIKTEWTKKWGRMKRIKMEWEVKCKEERNWLRDCESLGEIWLSYVSQ